MILCAVAFGDKWKSLGSVRGNLVEATLRISESCALCARPCRTHVTDAGDVCPEVSLYYYKLPGSHDSLVLVNISIHHAKDCLLDV